MPNNRRANTPQDFSDGLRYCDLIRLVRSKGLIKKYLTPTEARALSEKDKARLARRNERRQLYDIMCATASDADIRKFQAATDFFAKPTSREVLAFKRYQQDAGDRAIFDNWESLMGQAERNRDLHWYTKRSQMGPMTRFEANSAQWRKQHGASYAPGFKSPGRLKPTAPMVAAVAASSRRQSAPDISAESAKAVLASLDRSMIADLQGPNSSAAYPLAKKKKRPLEQAADILASLDPSMIADLKPRKVKKRPLPAPDISSESAAAVLASLDPSMIADLQPKARPKRYRPSQATRQGLKRSKIDDQIDRAMFEISDMNNSKKREREIEDSIDDAMMEIAYENDGQLPPIDHFIKRMRN